MDKLFRFGVRIRPRPAIFRMTAQLWPARRWLTQLKAIADESFDTGFPNEILPVLGRAEGMYIHGREPEKPRLHRDPKWTNFLERLAMSSPGLKLHATLRMLRHVVHAGDHSKFERVYEVFRKASLELPRDIATDAAHDMVQPFSATRVRYLLDMRVSLPTYCTEATERLMATVDEDLIRIWLPNIFCGHHTDVTNIAGQLVRLGKVDNAVYLLSRYARGRGSTVDLEALRQRAIVPWIWTNILNALMYRQLKTPSEVWSVVILAHSLGVDLPTTLYDSVIRYHLQCRPYSAIAVETCFKHMSDNGIKFQPQTLGLRLWSKLRQGPGGDAVALRRLAHIVERGTIKGRHPDASANALLMYEASHQDWPSVLHRLEQLYLDGHLLAEDAIIAVHNSPDLQRPGDNAIRPPLSPNATQLRSQLVHWVEISRALYNHEQSLEDRVDEALKHFEAIKDQLRAASSVVFLKPIITQVSHHIEAGGIPSTRQRAQIVAIYDSLVWPERGQEVKSWLQAGGLKVLLNLLFFFAKAHDMKRIALLCMEGRLHGLSLGPDDIYGIFRLAQTRETHWEDAAACYECLRLVARDGVAYSCLGYILNLPPPSGQHYPSAIFFRRLVTGYDSKVVFTLMKSLLRRYHGFLRLNWRAVGSYGPDNEIDPGHLEYIGAQVRQLHGMMSLQQDVSDSEVKDRCRALLLSLYFYTNQFQEAIALWNSYPEHKKYASAIISIVIDGCGIQGRLDVAERIWKDTRDRVHPEANTWGAWLECLCRHSRESFQRARDTVLFEMGPNGGLPDIPPADVGFVRLIISFGYRYGALDETVQSIETHLPTVWCQLSEVERKYPDLDVRLLATGSRSR